MAHRLVEIVVPAGRVEHARAALAELDALGVQELALADGTALLRVLVETKQSEAVLDRMEERLAWSEGYRLVLLPVEATLPRPPEPEPAAAAEPDAAADADAPAPLPERISREELLDDLQGGLRTTRVYLATVALSTVVAVVGLARDDVAILIGAMVIAPLLAPNVALALATTLGDLERVRRALRTNAHGVLLAFALAVVAGLVLPLDPETAPAVLARTRVDLADPVLALAAGCAGALAFTTGVPAGLVGVMVAVALLPPLVVAGMMLAAGRVEPCLNALLLLATNVICVNLTAVLTFAARGIRPRTWWRVAEARRARRVAVATWSALLAVLAALIVVQGLRR